MSVHRLEREQLVPRALPEVFEFFSRAGNLERITPPWLSFGLITPEPIELRSGTLIEYRLRVHGLPLRWVSRIEEWEENRVFVDRQLQGPYGLWHHRHEFAAIPQGTRVRDHVDYALPFGLLGDLVHSAVVRRDLTRIFDYRNQAVARLLG
ncbi:MAG TPA: SRPBCC family protein [Solirubrobacteraceae bacterium]